MVTVVARIHPELLVELAGRDDLDSDLHEHLVRTAPSYLVVELLEVWAPDPGLVRAAVEAHGALPDLVVWCGAQGWVELAGELAGQVEWMRVRGAVSRWSNVVGEEMPASVRLVLVDAALTEREPLPDVDSMTDWEQREALERLDQERAERAQVAWSLLEGHPQLWVALARDGEHAMQIRRILLEQPDQLTDEVRQAAEDRRPKLIEVPSDDELAAHEDPAAALRTHVKHLKGRAAQRDLTIYWLLRSRFTTPEILRALPAMRVLDAAEQADQVAELLATACGDDEQRWNALPALSDQPPARTTTFGAWLDRPTPADPEPVKRSRRLAT